MGTGPTVEVTVRWAVYLHHHRYLPACLPCPLHHKWCGGIRPRPFLRLVGIHSPTGVSLLGLRRVIVTEEIFKPFQRLHRRRRQA